MYLYYLVIYTWYKFSLRTRDDARLMAVHDLKLTPGIYRVVEGA